MYPSLSYTHANFYYTDNNIHVMVTIDTSLLHIPSLEAGSCVGTEAVA